jgi:hypothetical protein
VNIPANIKLSRLAHESIADGVCAMELASVLAGEEWSDHPDCVAPVIGDYMRTLNDHWDDEARQRLIPYVPKVLGTVDRCGETGEDRGRARHRAILSHSVVRRQAPDWLYHLGYFELAAQLYEGDPLGARAGLDALRSLRHADDPFNTFEACYTVMSASGWTPAASIAGGVLERVHLTHALLVAMRLRVKDVGLAEFAAKAQPLIADHQDHALDLIDQMVAASR